MIECLRCATQLKPETEVCPKCGSRDRKITIDDYGKGLEIERLKQISKAGVTNKIIKTGEKISKTGKVARETLIIDKKKRWKYHTVEEQKESGEWVLVHSEDEHL